MRPPPPPAQVAAAADKPKTQTGTRKRSRNERRTHVRPPPEAMRKQQQTDPKRGKPQKHSTEERCTHMRPPPEAMRASTPECLAFSASRSLCSLATHTSACGVGPRRVGKFNGWVVGGGLRGGSGMPETADCTGCGRVLSDNASRCSPSQRLRSLMQHLQKQHNHPQGLGASRSKWRHCASSRCLTISCPAGCVGDMPFSRNRC